MVIDAGSDKEEEEGPGWGGQLGGGEGQGSPGRGPGAEVWGGSPGSGPGPPLQGLYAARPH